MKGRFALYIALYKCKKLLRNGYVPKSIVRFVLLNISHYNRILVCILSVFCIREVDIKEVSLQQRLCHCLM